MLGSNKRTLKFRINIMFFISFLLFALLVFRLGMVQIVNGKEYVAELNKNENKIVENSVPRGKIVDRNGSPIVINEPLNAVTYTRAHGASTQDHLDIAEQLARFINKDTSQVTQRDMKDYWMLTHPDKARNKITEEELKTLSDDEIYQLQLDRTTKADLNQLSQQDIEVIAVKRELDQASTFSQQLVDRDHVTNKEVAVVNAHLKELTGINTMVDWNRRYQNGDALRSLLGNVTNPKEGLPQEELNYYLSRGYERNDRVGISFLEKEYEFALQGNKTKVLYEFNNSGTIQKSTVVANGQMGDEVALTIDIELQKKVEEIIEEELKKAKATLPQANRFLDSAYAILMNPQSGEILAMAGKTISSNTENKELQFYDSAIGNILYAYPMGSAVKAATILTAYETGTLEPGTVLLDAPIKIRNTPVKKSYENMGNITDMQAIKRSSNVYMWRIAMKLGQYDYQYNQAGTFNNPAAFDTMRYYFSQFGLGTHTRIDLPYEATGYKGSGRKIGFLMDLAIGQYDTYTPLQMAQYISTIANDGFRMRPHLVKEIWEPSQQTDKGRKLLLSVEPKVINRVDMKKEHIDRVQQALHSVMKEPGGTGYAYFHDSEYEVAGKTGTAEVLYYPGGYNSYNLTFVGYAPVNDPEIAFAVVVPYASDDYGINKHIARKSLDAYFKLNKKEQVENTEENDQE